MEKRGFLILFVIAVSLLPAVATPQVREYSVEVDPVPATAATASGLNYSTGFEPGEGFPIGYISNTPGTYPAGCGGAAFPCWGHTSATGFSLITPTIENLHPASGIQHLRLTHDPTTRTNIPNFGLGIDARYPRTADLSVRPVAPNTASIMMAISNPGGMNYRIQPQSNSQGGIGTSTLFYYTGAIYVLDQACGFGGVGFAPTGRFWDTTGGYQNYTVATDPCQDHVSVSYGGAPLNPDVNAFCSGPGSPYACCTGLHTGTCVGGCIILGTNLEQILVFGDNFPGSDIDIDNLALSSLDSCPCICGNGIIENVCEQCEPHIFPSGCNPGHSCNPNDCQCSRTCTLNEPCELHNGANGPFYGPFDATHGGIFIYNAPAGVDAVSVELCGSTGADQRIFYWGSCADPKDPGSANDDCCDPADSICGADFGAGSDPSASCYNNVGSPNWVSCTCHSNPDPNDHCYLLQIRGGINEVARIEVNKKAVCGEGHLGACCDTNGLDTGCTDNVLQVGCTGADKVWTENGKCESVSCSCIPDCTDAECGDDGCGGSCGSCDDGNACNGVETCNANRICNAGTPLNCNDGNRCNGFESCEPSSGCVPGTPLNCNDGVACNGLESCNPSSGCVAGTPVNCDDGIDCTVDACNEPTGTCTHDDADCAIPTVSQWGLVALALALLVVAKVGVGRPARTSESR